VVGLDIVQEGSATERPPPVVKVREKRKRCGESAGCPSAQLEHYAEERMLGADANAADGGEKGVEGVEECGVEAEQEGVEGTSAHAEDEHSPPPWVNCCLECGRHLGESNGRQYCRKTYCDNDAASESDGSEIDADSEGATSAEIAPRDDVARDAERLHEEVCGARPSHSRATLPSSSSLSLSLSLCACSVRRLSALTPWRRMEARRRPLALTTPLALALTVAARHR
jgi:hypothetical protein